MGLNIQIPNEAVGRQRVMLYLGREMGRKARDGWSRMGRMIIGVRRRDISADARWCCHFKDLLALLLSVGLVTKFTKDFRHLFLLLANLQKKKELLCYYLQLLPAQLPTTNLCDSCPWQCWKLGCQRSHRIREEDSFHFARLDSSSSSSMY